MILRFLLSWVCVAGPFVKKTGQAGCLLLLGHVWSGSSRTEEAGSPRRCHLWEDFITETVAEVERSHPPGGHTEPVLLV